MRKHKFKPVVEVLGPRAVPSLAVPTVPIDLTPVVQSVYDAIYLTADYLATQIINTPPHSP